MYSSVICIFVSFTYRIVWLIHDNFKMILYVTDVNSFKCDIFLTLIFTCDFYLLDFCLTSTLDFCIYPFLSSFWTPGLGEELFSIFDCMCSILYFLEMFFVLYFTFKSIIVILYSLTGPWLIPLWSLIRLIKVVLDYFFTGRSGRCPLRYPEPQVSLSVQASLLFLTPTNFSLSMKPKANIHQDLSIEQITLLHVVKSFCGNTTPIF